MRLFAWHFIEQINEQTNERTNERTNDEKLFKHFFIIIFVVIFVSISSKYCVLRAPRVRLSPLNVKDYTFQLIDREFI